ncbi:MAG TPA: YihY/virulence factor BrkB family protein [Rubricoccaceae bacterium]|nr:YihY/virulence factor BrkB family protein [Rubricoccaceae bacterium]
MPRLLKILERTVDEVGRDDVASLSAAIAYYTVFSLPPLLVVIVAVAGVWFGPEAVREALFGEVGSLVGPDGARALQEMIDQAGQIGEGITGKLVGAAVLLFGATGAFAGLQKALNRAWGVEPPPGVPGKSLFARVRGELLGILFKRLLSFGMVVTFGFLLLVSMVIGAVIEAFGDGVSPVAPEGALVPVLRIVNLAVSFGVTTVLFAALFVFLPDRRVPWRVVWLGATVTAALFSLGRFLLGFYLGRSEIGSAFGAAGTLALILVWIYYSAFILLVGAEFTQVWAEEKHGLHLSGAAEALRFRDRFRRRRSRHFAKPEPEPPHPAERM